MNGRSRPLRPTALLVTSDPARHRETRLALGRRGVHVDCAEDDHQVAAGLSRLPSLVLVDLSRRAPLSQRTVRRINRLRGRALVVALHEGSLDGAAHAYSELSVDGFCPTGRRAAGPLSAFAAGPGAPGFLQIH